MEKLRQPLRLLLLAALLGGCLWIAWQVPYTHDDWDWGSPVGLEWWRTGAVNNRFCGSFFAVVMTRSQVVKTLVMGLTMWALPLLAAALAVHDRRENRFPLALLGCAALMIMPMCTWQQTYGWVAAFSNFALGGLWMLALPLLVRRGLDREGQSGAIPLLLFPLALTAQLFAENITAVLAVSALLFALWSWRSGRGRPVSLALLVGALTGLVLMFYNPLYADLLATGSAVNGVRKLAVPLEDGPVRLVLALAERFFGSVLPELFECYPALWALACAGGLWKTRRVWYLALPSALFSAFFLLCCWKRTDCIRLGILWDYPLPGLRVWGPAVLCLLLALACAGSDNPLPRLALLAAALALAAPFAALDEKGSRCWFPSALLVLVLGLSLLDDFPWNLPLAAGAAALLAGAVLFHIQVYQVIGGCSALRDRLIQEALDQGQTSVVLPVEDWAYFYSWQRNPQSQFRAASFRTFYGLPEEMELVFLQPGSYDAWPDITPEMMYYAARY